jgi:hypothetical protein
MGYANTKLVGVNERGDRVGEDHPRAKLSDAEVDLIRELLDPLDGAKPMSHRQVAAKFEISRGTVADIASCRRRAQVPSSFKRIPVTARFVEPMRAEARFNGDL